MLAVAPCEKPCSCGECGFLRMELMMTVQELFCFFEEKFERDLCASWDNDGLSCAPDPQKEVKRVLVALDPTAEAVERAISGGFDVLLTHHPLLFKGIKALTPACTVPRKLLQLALGGVAAMSFHTRLDAVVGGVNDILAEKLGLLEVVPFAPEGEVLCGRIGTLPAPLDAADFALLVKKALGAPAVLISGSGTVQRIALCGGEGGDFLEAARELGADLFLAGRIGYHRMLDAPEDGMLTLEAGHYATEFPVCEHLAELTLAADPTIAVEIFETAKIRTV